MKPLPPIKTVPEVVSYVNRIIDELTREITKAKSIRGTHKLYGNLDLNGHRIINLQLVPSDERDAITLSYNAVAPPAIHAPSHENGGVDEINVGGLDGLLATLQNPVDHGHTASGGGVGGKLDHDAALNNLNWAVAGHIMDAALDMDTQLINNVVDPVDNQDAATKKFVDDLLLLYLLIDGTRAMTGSLQTVGRRKSTIRVTSSPYNILSSDEVVFVDTDGGVITVNLPAGVDGASYKIINTGSSGNNVTVTPNGAELLNGVNASDTLADSENIIITYETTEGWW